MSTSADAGLLILRMVVFVVVGFHGTQKLFGWWDGGGLSQAGRFIRQPGLPAATAHGPRRRGHRDAAARC